MDDQLLLFVAVGFCAQLIDGALGMAYGVSSTTFLLSLGIPPAVASAGVHTAEVFTTMVSGVSHLKFGNVDLRLLKRLVIPGIIGGILGAYILASVPGRMIKPFVAAYLLVMGIRIFWKAFNGAKKKKHYKRLFPLGLCGGFLDAIGITTHSDHLEIPVTHIAPAKIMGSGLGSTHAYSGDYDIQLFDQATRQEYGLDDLRLGDLVAITNADHSYGRIYKTGAISIGIISHTNCIISGHGPGVTTLFTSSTGALIPRISSQANIAAILQLR